MVLLALVEIECAQEISRAVCPVPCSPVAPTPCHSVPLPRATYWSNHRSDRIRQEPNLYLCSCRRFVCLQTIFISGQKAMRFQSWNLETRLPLTQNLVDLCVPSNTSLIQSSARWIQQLRDAAHITLPLLARTRHWAGSTAHAVELEFEFEFVSDLSYDTKVNATSSPTLSEQIHDMSEEHTS